MRGIVVTPEIDGDENSLHIKNINIDSNKLRQYLLYWDKIDFPSNNIIYMESSPEVEFLQKSNVLKRTNYIPKINGVITINPQIFLDMQMYAFNQNNNNQDNEVWSIAQPTKKILLPKEDSIKARTLQVELYNSIPVPTSNVNLEDILNFKEHRYHELEEFRYLMDKMYISIMDSPDKDLLKDIAIVKLQNKINELNKVMDESKIKRFLSTVKVELDFSGLGTLLGVGVGHTINSSAFSTIVGAVGGAVISSIKVSSEMSLKPREVPAELKDYAYLYYQNKELI